jgi:hypothetical protein
MLNPHKLDGFEDYCVIRKKITKVIKYSVLKQEVGVLLLIYDKKRSSPYYSVFIHKHDIKFYLDKFVRFLNEQILSTSETEL